LSIVDNKGSVDVGDFGRTRWHEMVLGGMLKEKHLE